MAAVLCGLMFLSCAEKKEDALVGGGFDEYTTVSGSLAAQNDAIVDGTALLRFLTTSSSALDIKSISLQAEMPSNLSAITFYAHSSSLNLTDGVQVRFERQGANVVGYIKINNEPMRQINSQRLTGVLPNKLDLVIEVQNSPTQPRVVIWELSADPRTHQNFFFDSSIAGHLDSALPLQAATGVFFGLKLENTRITRARLGTSAF